MRKLLTGLTIASGLFFLIPAAPASAEAVQACVTTVLAPTTFTFENGLGLTASSGSVDIGYTNTCVYMNDGGGAGVRIYSHSMRLEYQGTCIAAGLSGPLGHFGEIVGGTDAVIAVSDSTSTQVANFTLDPTQVCNASPGESIAVVASEGAFVYTV